MDDNTYKKVPLTDIGENDPAPEVQKYGWGVRHIQTFLIFLSLTVLYMARSQLGVTIVAMTILPNDTATVNNSNYLLNIEDVDGNKSELTSQNNSRDFENNLENNTYEEIDTSSLYRKYNWSKPIQEMIQSSFFFGYVLTQFLLSMVAQRWGGKICLQIGLSVNALTSFAIPWLVLWGGWRAMCAVRVVQGLTQAGTYPSIQLLLAEWVPKNERGTLNSYVYTGGTVGTVLGFQLAGIISESFGWPAVFWGAGIICTLTFVSLTIFGSDSPYKHKTITEEEKNYITHEAGGKPKQKPKLPWKSIWTSIHVWAIYVTHSGSGLTFLFILMQVPTYIHYALEVDVKNSGILSSLPYFASIFTAILFGTLSDFMTNRNILSVKNGRRLFNSIAQVGVALCLIAFSYTKDVGVAIFLLVTAMACHSGINVGWIINYIDLAPNFGGTLVAIGNTILNILVLLVPVMVSYIVTDVSDQYQWRILFILAASITLAANAFFVIFMSAEKQPWNDMENEQTDTEEIQLERTKEKK